MRGSSRALAWYSDCQKGTDPEDDSACQPSPMSPETGESNRPSEMSLHVAESKVNSVNGGKDQLGTPKTCLSTWKPANWTTSVPRYPLASPLPYLIENAWVRLLYEEELAVLYV